MQPQGGHYVCATGRTIPGLEIRSLEFLFVLLVSGQNLINLRFGLPCFFFTFFFSRKSLFAHNKGRVWVNIHANNAAILASCITQYILFCAGSHTYKQLTSAFGKIVHFGKSFSGLLYFDPTVT